MAHRLDGVRAKLRRANGHAHAIEDRIELWREDEPYEFVHDEESEPGWTVLRIWGGEPPPIEVGVIAGEYVHNVRSALDHLVWQLVLANGAVPGKHNEFPIALTEGYFDQRAIAGEKAMLAGVTKDAKRFIRGQQPYKRGDDAPSHPLAILQELWNTDKHQSLAQAVNVFDPIRALGVQYERVGGVVPPTSRRVVDGMELDRWPTPAPQSPSPGGTTGQARHVGSLKVGVLFGESEVRLNTLLSLREEAKAITDHFAASPILCEAAH